MGFSPDKIPEGIGNAEPGYVKNGGPRGRGISGPDPRGTGGLSVYTDVPYVQGAENRRADGGIIDTPSQVFFRPDDQIIPDFFHPGLNPFLHRA
jgi:hypothetical protein